jgi:hypothetical protein
MPSCEEGDKHILKNHAGQLRHGISNPRVDSALERPAANIAMTVLALAPRKQSLAA